MLTHEVLKIDETCIYGYAHDDADPGPRGLVVEIDGEPSPGCSTGYDPKVFMLPRLPQASFFAYPLPLTTNAAEAAITIVDEKSGTQIFDRSVPIKPLRHVRGLNAADILAMQAAPLTKLTYQTFNGASLVLNGFCHSSILRDSSSIGMAADRREISVTCSDGIVAKVDPFVPQLKHGATFWYIPNARFSGLSVEIPMADCAFNAREIAVEVTIGDEEPDAATRLARTTWVPTDLTRYFCFPSTDRLTRVQTFETMITVGLNGYSDARRLRALLELHDMPLTGKRILDWGCGHGRVLRHFVKDGDLERCVGLDIDPDNIAWASESIVGGEFVHGPLFPPTGIADNAFDAIYGISVMTHLMPDVQEAWLAELARILAPGGRAMLTYGGPTAVAWSSQHYTPQWISTYRAQGYNTTKSETLDKFIGKANYYINVQMTPEYMRNLWSKYFDVVAVHPAMFGMQDLVVLAKKRAPRSSASSTRPASR